MSGSSAFNIAAHRIPPLTRPFVRSAELTAARLGPFSPNAVTVSSGLTAIVTCLSAVRMSGTVGALFVLLGLSVAYFLDCLDGSLARAYDLASTNGARLDLLTDFLSLGAISTLVAFRSSPGTLGTVLLTLSIFALLFQATVFRLYPRHEGAFKASLSRAWAILLIRAARDHPFIILVTACTFIVPTSWALALLVAITLRGLGFLLLTAAMETGGYSSERS